MTDRRSGNALRWAWAASVVVHGLLFAAGVWVVSRPADGPTPRHPDASLIVAKRLPEHEPFRFSFVESVPTPLPEPSPPPEPIRPPVPDTKPTPDPEPVGPPVGRLPRPIPSPLTGPIASLVRDIADRPVAVVPVADVVDIQGDIRQVAATDVVSTTVIPSPKTTAPPASPKAVPTPPPGTTPFGVGTPVHGELPAGRSIVYVLDCSGTMGLDGKLDRARAAILATLAGQSDEVRTQVVVYRGKAELLTRSDLIAALTRLEPGGASRHADGVRAALKLDPDYVVLFTDATDAELASVRPLLRGVRTPVAVSVARVSAGRVASPVELR